MIKFSSFHNDPAHCPYTNPALNNIYNMLFCDDLEVYKANGQQLTGYPWDVLFAEEPPVENLLLAAKDNTLESRQQLLAYNRLAQIGKPAPNQQLLGVIVEVALPEGLDVVAVYRDSRARYINYSGKIIIWETPTGESQELVNLLFDAGNEVIRQIGPWEEERRPFPVEDMVRLNFLVSDGLYFGEAPFSVMEEEPMGGPVLAIAAQLMVFLTEHTA